MDPDTEKSIETQSIVEKAAEMAEKYSSKYAIKRDDSTDELLNRVHAQREARKKQLLAAAEAAAKDEEADSGRSTPEHLKKYSNSTQVDLENGNNKRLRTFSETLKMLDEDILQELDVKWSTTKDEHDEKIEIPKRIIKGFPRADNIGFY